MERLAENFDLFSFQLSEEQIEQIGKLDRHLRFNDPVQNSTTQNVQYGTKNYLFKIFAG